MNSNTSEPGAHTEGQYEHVHSVFESIAPKYDIMNDILSFRRHKAWRKFTMKKMAIKPGDTAVDICCGTCDWTLSIAEASRSGSIVGLDFSSNMLKVGEQKNSRQTIAGSDHPSSGRCYGTAF